MADIPFIPMGSGISIASTTASAAVALPAIEAMYARAVNLGTSVAHLRFGASDVAAGTGDAALYPGTDQIFAIGRGTGISYVATRTATGSTTIQLIKGEIVK